MTIASKQYIRIKITAKEVSTWKIDAITLHLTNRWANILSCISIYSFFPNNHKIHSYMHHIEILLFQMFPDVYTHFDR